MLQEKLTRKEIELAIEGKKGFLVTEMAKLWEVFEPIQEELALQVHKVSGEIVGLFQQKKQLETDQKTQEEEQKFSEIEKNVLASLSKAEQKRIATMRSQLQNNCWEKYEISYKQAIIKLHNNEAIIGADAVQFIYAHKELYTQELQLPKDEDIFDHTYEDFDGKKITRREIKQKVLDKNSKQYHYIQEAGETLKQEGKYIATEENTFSAILNWFEWNIDQKIRSMQFLTWFVGRWIISLGKDKNNCRRFLGSRRYKLSSYIYDYNTPDYKGSLFVAKDC